MCGLYEGLLVKTVIECMCKVDRLDSSELIVLLQLGFIVANVVLGITYFQYLGCITFTWTQDFTSSHECLCSLELTTGADFSEGEAPLNIAISVTLGSRSHAKYLFEISEILKNRGHSFTYLCTDDTLKFSEGYNINHKIVAKMNSVFSPFESGPFTRMSKMGFSRDNGAKLTKVYTKSFPFYENYYKEERPDLIICDYVSPSYIESKALLGIKNGLEPATIENYSFWERLNHGLIDPIKYKFIYYLMYNKLNNARKEFGIPNEFSLTHFTNMGLRIANSYIGFENTRPLPSNVYPIGSILPDKLSPLSLELNFFLNSRQKVLYIAFGSLIKFKSNISTNMLEHFQRLLNEGWIDGIIWGGLKNTNFEKFPKFYTVNGVEYSTEKILEGTHDDFKFLKWAPQDAILNHENVKLFITHAGLESIYESIQSGTPMLAIPFFVGQPLNSVLIKEHGIGDYIEWPLDGDILIHQKMVNLIDPSSIQLKSKLNQFQKINQFSSNRKLFAAELIETYAYSAKTCRLSETPKSFEIPCEVKLFLPLDHQISAFKANLIDVYAAGIVILLAIVGLIALIIRKLLAKACRYFNNQKKE
ncbi:glycosyltransferase family 1 protein [Conidiobolus coronatus NRRL 28638]|uniref:Glycosyltransferase family 1 protein n=1 Tax=Conidiobolus coronatus (strain ATCC 28846 / CBS 209.66 / NRRL 28638) TaxID=796925 RepID=A0A137NXJ7_CONC2|nr:glycosyltransferase family 1 protein [Conidiobolus coronatus NRRL 28638]|eukprot:KXN67516.1 glycosyltransferase family 1 protein [Conidiobolus coronatus NRRL 28638]